MKSVKYFLLSLLLFAAVSQAPHAYAGVSVVASGELSYTVQGTGMDGVAGIQLDIAYNSALLNTPTATQGSLVAGAMFAANTPRPGLIKIAIISTRAFSGSGPIATITFASKNASAPLPTIITASMIDINGSPIGTSEGNQPSDVAAGNQTGLTGQTGQIQTGQTGQAGTIPTSPGTVTLPADLQQRADPRPATPSTVPLEEPPEVRFEEQDQPNFGKPTVETKTEETPQYVIYKGIIDRFKQDNGSKTLHAMVALFDKKVVQTVHQEPPILLSDGHSKATLTVDMPARINSSPKFAVNGGRLVSAKQDNQNKRRWIVDVLPEAGAFRVTLTIIAGAEEFKFPLTVAPPVKTALTLDEPGWNRFLKEVGTPNAPLHDLNNDGVRNYMDEFVFIANYLYKIAQSKPKK